MRTITYKKGLDILESVDYRTHKTWKDQSFQLASSFLHSFTNPILRFPIINIINPNPGEYQDWIKWNNSIRVLAAFTTIALPFLFAYGAWQSPLLLTLPIFFLFLHFSAHLLRIKAQSGRPLACILLPKEDLLDLEAQNELHVGIHNIALTPNTVNAVECNLRDAQKRVEEILEALRDGPNPPHIICFQEAALQHEDAEKKLILGLQECGYAVIHNVAKNLAGAGFGSGLMIASKVPINFEKFHPFKNVGHRGVVPRGLLIFSLHFGGKQYMIANTHLESLEKSAIRLEQVKEIVALLETKNLENTQFILCGDFNISKTTEAGTPNTDLCDIESLKILNEKFTDLFNNDHHSNGARKSDEPRFLKDDLKYMKEDYNREQEPLATWYFKKDIRPKVKEEFEYVTGQNSENPYDNDTWGTSRWKETKSTQTARYDGFLFFKSEGNPGVNNTTIEIRYNITKEKLPSSTSDHLPVSMVLKR